MFERLLSENLGETAKKTLRAFANRKRMSEEDYLYALEAYNSEVRRRRNIAKQEKKTLNILPAYIEINQEELKQNRKAEQQKNLQRKKENKELLKIKKSVIADFKHNKVNTDNETGLYSSQIENKLLDIAKKLVGKKMVVIQSSNNGEIYFNQLVNIVSNNYRTIFYDNILPAIQTYISGDIYNIFVDGNGYGRITIFDSAELLPEKYSQKYLDGEVHCVINPIRSIFQRYADNSESKESRRKMMSVVNKLNQLEKIYEYGVPEDDMEIIGKAVSRCIIINNIFGKEIKKYNSKSSKYIHFTNTRNNHLDVGQLTITGEYTLVSQKEMNEIVDEHIKNKEFYLMDGNVDGMVARVLSSAKGNWRVVNEDYEIYKEFDEYIGKKNYGLDAVEYKDLNEFIKEARIINATPVPLCDKPNDITYAHHIDISKAYTQHKYCKNYQGFLGHIHNYCKLDNITNALEFMQNHIGIYQAKVLFNKNKLINQLGIIEGNSYTLPSVEWITFIKDYGIKIQLIAGCWGSSFDIEYTDDLLQNRRYAIWAGKLGQDSPYQKFTFTGSKEWAKQLKYDLGNENVYYFNEFDMISVKLDHKHYNTYHHILAFITSYTRLNMLEVMSKIDGELIKVILDGIYYRGEVQDVVIPHHKDKELKTHLGFREFWYYPTMLNLNNWAKYNNDFDGNAILAGAGGTGKTYSVYHYKGLIKPLYVVPSHILGKKMRDTYGCDYTTINRLIGDDCQSYKEMFKEPHTILIDELTMTNKPFIEKAINMYPNSLILLAGDIDENKRWFQCRNGDANNYNEIFMPNDWKYIYYTNDRRSKDDKIRALKQDIRNQMIANFKDGGLTEAMLLKDHILLNYNTMSFENAIKEFKSGDIWIAGTHKTNKCLIENGVVSGYINNKKEINFNGEGEKRGSFTIHSYQGLTIEKERVFISLDLFEYAMLYTAISRCSYFNQITFVLTK